MKTKTAKWSLLSLIAATMLLSACTSDVVPPPSGPDVPCDPSVIYYSKDIQPILSSACAYSGCHDGATSAEGVTLDNYDNVMASRVVKAGDPNGSELFRVLRSSGEKQMPPAPNSPLSNPQIELIKEWINQGAMNLTCGGGCDNSNPTWTSRVWPIVEANCRACHSGGAPSGGIRLSNYAEVKVQADNGRLAATIELTGGFSLMPPSNPLSQCDIEAINLWIADGALQN